MASEVPWIYSVPIPINAGNPPGVRPSTTKATKLNFEEEEMKNLGEKANFVDLDVPMGRWWRLWHFDAATRKAPNSIP